MEESATVRLIEKVCADLGKDPPKVISFVREAVGRAHYYHGGKIEIPFWSFVKEHRMFTSQMRMGYRLWVLHETAHHIVGPEFSGHSDKFYMLLFQLCQQYGVDLDFAREDEIAYKPTRARKGWKLFQATQG